MGVSPKWWMVLLLLSDFEEKTRRFSESNGDFVTLRQAQSDKRVMLIPPERNPMQSVIEV
ncbi:MAG: hypothetical protein D6681_11080 [Calditrichaeota bacterium]|nr:MAG: hypothetical protein D6681_11080 [Calditrichota bacterium]